MKKRFLYFFVAEVAFEGDHGACQLSECLRLVSASDDNKAFFQIDASPDGEIDALVIDEAGNYQVIIVRYFNGWLGIELCSGINRHCVPMVEFSDALPDEIGIADKEVNTVGGLFVPESHPMYHARHQFPFQPSCVGTVFVIHIPDVSGRRMAVADMRCLHRGDDSLAATGTGTDDEIKTGKIEGFEFFRHERKEVLV